MAPPTQKYKNHVSSTSLKQDSSRSDLKSTQNKSRKNYYKNNFKFYLGNSKQGHGFVAAQKKKFVSRFNRKFKKKSGKEVDSTYIAPKPLAEDLSRTTSQLTVSGISDESTICSGNSLIESKDSVNNETSKTNRQSKHVRLIEVNYQAIQEERNKKYEELQASILKHEETVLKNIQKRKRITKKFSKRTRRGQPVMANRLEHILDKIKSI